MANYVSNVTIPTDGGSTASYNIRELFPHVGNCTVAASAAAKTVTIGNFKLYTGAWVVVKFSNTNSADVASLTLNVDGTGAKPIKYRNANLSSAGLLIANRYTYFVYDGTNYQIVGDFDTNSDTYDRNRYKANIKAGTSALVAANIIVGKDGVFNHLKSGGSFDISYPILYLNGAVAAGETTDNSYNIINFTITTTQSISLTAYLPVFIKGTLSGKIFTPVSTAPLTQTVPTTDDGYQYMYLGNATSTSAVYLTERHPIYAYKNNAFGEITNYSANAGSVAWSNITGKPSTFTPASGSDYYVKNLTRSSRSTATTKSWVSMCNSSQTGAPTLPTSGKWWHVLSLDCWNGAPNNWVSQLALPTQDDSSIYYRKNPSSGTSIESGTWIKVLDSNNYTSYTVKKDGTGATGSWGINITGNAANVTGTVAIANGGTGATTRLNALKNLTNENVGSSANYFLTITSSWGKGGYTSVADAKTVLGLKSAAYTESSAYLSSTTKYAGSSSVGGAATSANALNLTHDNELNFSKLGSTGHVWFGYRWNTQGTETSGGTTITTYKFGNADGAQGLAGLEASTSTFKSGNFGDQLIVERTGGANMAGIAFKNTSGVLGYIAADTVDGDLYHYGATDTSTMKYVILDSHNYTSYPLPRNIKHIHTASGTEGTTGWVKIARITVTNLYANHPMTFTIAQRGLMQYRIHLVFVNNVSVAAAAISQFIIARDNSWTDTDNYPRAYIIKPSDGIFDLYIRKTEAYDHIFVVDFTKADDSEGDNYSVTWTNVHAADSAITGGTEAVKKLYLLTTTNYAGSSSVGGAANSSNVLNSNTRMDYGWNGVNYFNISGTAGNAAKVNDTPTTAWWHIMRFNHNNNNGYYTDLAIPFNATSLYYKRITSGSVQNGGWVKVLDALNVGYVMSSVIKYDSHARRFTSSKTDSAWNAQAYSNTGYADNVYVSFRPGQTTMYAMIGLDANPSEDANYDKIDYCWYIQNNGALKVYESGTAVTITGHTTYASGDEFRVEYSCGEIRYYHNGTMCRSVTRAVSGKLFFDSSFHNAGNVYDFSYGTSTHSTHTAEIITSTYKSTSTVTSLTSSVITLSDAASSFGGWICGPTKNGRIAISSYQGSDDKLYFGYGERGRTTNSYAKAMKWDGPTNTLTADKFVGALQGNATTSSSWATARTLALGGQLMGSVSVKGDANMTLNGYLDRAFIYDDNAVSEGHTWAEYAWHKFAEVTIATTWTDCVITFLVSRTFGNSAENTGILSAKLRTNGSKAYDTAQLKWLVRNSGLSKDDFVMVYTSTSGTSTKAELWCRLPDQYHGLIFTVLKEHKRQYSTDTSWTLVKTPDGTGSTHGSSSYPTTGITGTIISSDGTIANSTTGTANRATYLDVVSSNEIRFYNNNQFTASDRFWIGYSWAQGSHYTPSGGSDTSSTTAPNITKFIMGNCSAGGLASVHAKTFILGNGSSPTYSSKTTTIATAATTTDRTITLPDASGTLGVAEILFNTPTNSTDPVSLSSTPLSDYNYFTIIFSMNGANSDNSSSAIVPAVEGKHFALFRVNETTEYMMFPITIIISTYGNATAFGTSVNRGISIPYSGSSVSIVSARTAYIKMIIGHKS